MQDEGEYTTLYDYAVIATHTYKMSHLEAIPLHN